VASITAKNEAYFLRLLERSLPPEYVAPLKDTGPGYELLEASAAVGARLSTAVWRLYEGAFVISAPDGAKARCAVTFYRENAAAGALTILAGTVVASNQGRRFRLLSDVPLGAAQLEATGVEVEATIDGYQHNEPGPLVAADGTPLPGEVAVVDVLLTEPPYADPTIRVRQDTDAEGGSFPWLDAHGEDRGVPRLPGEDADAYRSRLQLLPDTVSRGAIERLVEAVLAPLSASGAVVETWEPTYTSCWDAPDEAMPENVPGLLCYDDPREQSPLRGRWVDDVEQAGTFIVVIPPLEALDERGVVLDDPAATKGAHLSPTSGGGRAVSAWDVPGDAVVVPAAWDGYDLPRQAVHKGLFDAVQRTRAGGFVGLVELDGQ